MHKTPWAVCAGTLLMTVVGIAFSQPELPAYPETRTVDVVDAYRRIQVVEVADPFRWLENGSDPDVQSWTEQQNALTRSMLDAFETERAQLRSRLLALHTVHVSSTPVRIADRYFFARREGTQDHPVLFVRIGGLEAPPQMVVDPNTFSDDGSVSLDWWFPSPDGKLVAYGKSSGGTEESTLYVRDVDSGTDLDLAIAGTRHAAIAWDPDGGGFTYTRHPAPGSVAAGDERFYRHVYYHKLATPPTNDPKLWGAGRPKEEWTNVFNSSDDRYQFLTTSVDWARQDLYIRPAGNGEFRPVAVELDALYDPYILGDQLILRTNFEAPRYRVVAAPLGSPGPATWRDVIPQQKGVIEDLVVVDGKLVINVMENAYARLFVHEADGRLIKEIELPGLGSVDDISGRPAAPLLLFTYSSFAYPPVVFQYDLRAHTTTVHDRLALDLELDRYETRQIWFNSADGTRVPMFVTHRKGLPLDGNNPVVLWAYGGFNISQTPQFYRAGIPWLDRGGIWAVANVRGGGEFGREWHRAGRLENKQNCFDDFIAAAEKLVADGYTRPERLGARGASNGGLLVGAVLTQRPELFRAVHCGVPLLDMLRYEAFSIGRFWIPEYGSASNPEQFNFLYAYSPYHQVRKDVEYPAVLLTTAEGDSRVDPLHARKMAAALQAATAAPRPILLWVEPETGHGAGEPLDKYLDQQLDIWTFFMWQLGVFESTTTAPASQPS